MSDITCPSCKGSKQLQIVHVKYAPGYSGPPITEMPCVVCNGKGVVSEEREQRMERGGQFHNYRVKVLGLGLREAARLWGFSGTELSRIEQGLIKTDWVPPGFVEPVKAAEPETGDSQPTIQQKRDAMIPLVEIVTKTAKMLAEERVAVTRPLRRLNYIETDNCGMSSESQYPDMRQLRAMTLQFKPELTHSVWVDTYLSDENDCQLPKDQLVERLKQGVRDGEWVAWRLIHIEQEVMGNVD